MQIGKDAPFAFGIYPFGNAGTAEGLASGRPDDMQEIGRAMRDLSGGKPLIPRTYVAFHGAQTSATVLDQIAMYARPGLKWDMVLRFQDYGSDLKPWNALIQTIVARYGSRLQSLQITNEANLTGVPGSADGSQPNVRRALVDGVLTARGEAALRGASLKIGFSAVTSRDPKDDFWKSLRSLSTTIAGKPDAFARAIDYVGFDMYPDVFGSPIRIQDMSAAVNYLLRGLRDTSLPAANIPLTVPIHIAENGWPTGGRPDRTEEKQALVLEAIIRAVYSRRRELNVTQYELFALRDANSAKDDLFNRFGIVRDDYSRKPAFEVYRKLIAELG